MQRALPKQAGGEREKRAKNIAAEGKSLAAVALGEVSDTMVVHSLANQLYHRPITTRTAIPVSEPNPPRSCENDVRHHAPRTRRDHRPPGLQGFATESELVLRLPDDGVTGETRP